jgi:hypothetical protein
VDKKIVLDNLLGIDETFKQIQSGAALVVLADFVIIHMKGIVRNDHYGFTTNQPLFI